MHLRINGKPLVAAGKEWKPGAGHVVFMLDDNYAFPRLIQFGPGGEGCPPAEAASPTAAVNAVPVEESQPIPIAATVELKSMLTQGNALSAEWDFGDGTAPVTVTTPAQQEALITHKFASGGTHTVTVKVHTDDLASPTVEASSHVTIAAKASQPPTATTGNASALSPTSELVKGAVNPKGSATTCLFEYGTTTIIRQNRALQNPARLRRKQKSLVEAEVVRPLRNNDLPLPARRRKRGKRKGHRRRQGIHDERLGRAGAESENRTGDRRRAERRDAEREGQPGRLAGDANASSNTGRPKRMGAAWRARRRRGRAARTWRSRGRFLG